MYLAPALIHDAVTVRSCVRVISLASSRTRPHALPLRSHGATLEYTFDGLVYGLARLCIRLALARQDKMAS
jgi:hypothetical protein